MILQSFVFMCYINDTMYSGNSQPRVYTYCHIDVNDLAIMYTREAQREPSIRVKKAPHKGSSVAKP